MDTKKDTSPSFLRRYRWPLLITLVIGVIGAFYTYQQKSNVSVSDYFTNYDKLPDSTGYYDADKDSLTDIPPMVSLDSSLVDSVPVNVPDSLFGFALPVYDSLPPIVTEIDSTATYDSLMAEKELMADSLDLAAIALAPSTPSVPATAPVSTSGEDIFDGLLPTTYQSADAEQAFRATYTSNTISTRGTYKLAAIAGKALLIDATPEVLEMLNTLAAEETIAGLTVSDRQGRIVYASTVRERGRLITTVYPDLPVTNEAINWMRQDGRTITGIPIFSVGGRVGTVFVTTN